MKIEITKKEYLSLLEDSEKLRRLENGGVDNWEWFSESLSRNEGDDFIGEWEAVDILEENEIFCGQKTKTLAPYDGDNDEVILARNYLMENYEYTEA